MTVYPPSEDSFLLVKEVRKYIKKLKNLNIKILDMGSGSGVQALTTMRAGIERKNILCADIDKEAIVFLKKNGLNAIYSDLFSKLKAQSKFNLVLFNAPYLPADKYDKKPDTTAGKRGNETIIRFLKQAKSHLAKEGVILFLFSSLSKPEEILEQARKLKFNVEKLSEENMGMMETIFVYKFSIP